MFRVICAAAMVAALQAGTVQAATLTGDDVAMTISNRLAAGKIDRAYTVGAGYEENGLGAHRIDFDAGGAGDELMFTAAPGSWCGFLTCSGGTTRIVFSDLDFGKGHVLAGFELFEAAFALSVDVISTDAIAFSFAEGAYSSPASGTFIAGRWLTRPETTPVPLPAAGWMLLAALGGLGVAGRLTRRRA